MDFAWSKEQQELRNAITTMARKTLNEGLTARDAKSEFNRAGWNACAELGIQGLCIPQEYGGLGLDAVTTVGALEALGYGSKDNGLSFSINAHMWTMSMPLADFATDEQKKKWLPGLCNGQLIGGNAMTEPSAGSDAYTLST